MNSRVCKKQNSFFSFKRQVLIIFSGLFITISATPAFALFCTKRDSITSTYQQDIDLRNFNDQFLEQLDGRPFQLNPEKPIKDPQGKPYLMLCAHGLTGSSYYMSGLAQFAAQNGLAVRTIPLSGHFIMGGFKRRASHWKSDIKCAINRAIDEGYTPVLCGYSTGGAAAFKYLISGKQKNKVAGFYGYAPAIYLAEELSADESPTGKNGNLFGPIQSMVRNYARKSEIIFESALSLGTYRFVQWAIGGSGALGISQEQLAKYVKQLYEERRSEEKRRMFETHAKGKRSPSLIGKDGLYVSVISSEIQAATGKMTKKLSVPVVVSFAERDGVLEGDNLIGQVAVGAGHKLLKDLVEKKSLKVSIHPGATHGSILDGNLTTSHQLDHEKHKNPELLASDIKQLIESLPREK